MSKKAKESKSHKGVNNENDFWQDAQLFLNSQISPNFEDNLKEYVKKKGYNENEFRLFKSMMEAALSVHTTTAFLKIYD